MFSVSSNSIAATLLPALPATLSVPVSDVASTRQTAVALPAPLSNTPLSDNEQAKGTPLLPRSTSSDATSSATGIPDSPAPKENGSPGSASAPFLAQAISQNQEEQNDSEIALANSFAHFAPATQYDTFLGYGIVKYRPSDAGLSPAAPSTEAEEDKTAPASAAASEYQAYSVTQSRNQSNLANNEPQLKVAG